MMPRIQVDKGAIRFVLGGANVMCPGITSAGGAIPVELPEGAPVAVYAQDKEHAMAVGLLRMSTADMCVGAEGRRLWRRRRRPRRGSGGGHCVQRQRAAAACCGCGQRQAAGRTPDCAQQPTATVSLAPSPRAYSLALLFTRAAPPLLPPPRARARSRSKNKGIAIELLHHLDDALWHIPRFD